MKWNVYQLERERDLASQVGMKEKLTFFPINGTVPSYNQLQLNMPPRTLDLGLYKLVFKFEGRNKVCVERKMLSNFVFWLVINWNWRCRNIQRSLHLHQYCWKSIECSSDGWISIKSIQRLGWKNWTIASRSLLWSRWSRR